MGEVKSLESCLGEGGRGDKVPGGDGSPARGFEFAEARVRPDVNLFDAVGEHFQGLIAAGTRVIVTAYSAGSRDRRRK